MFSPFAELNLYFMFFSSILILRIVFNNLYWHLWAIRIATASVQNLKSQQAVLHPLEAAWGPNQVKHPVLLCTALTTTKAVVSPTLALNRFKLMLFITGWKGRQGKSMPAALGNFLTNALKPLSHKWTDLHSKTYSRTTFSLYSYVLSAFELPSFSLPCRWRILSPHSRQRIPLLSSSYAENIQGYKAIITSSLLVAGAIFFFFE